MNRFRVSISLGMTALALVGLGGIHVGCSNASGQDPALRPFFATDPLVEEIVDQISRENIEVILKGMESFETRHTQSETESDTRGIGGARRWLKEQVEAYSPRLNVYLDRWVSDADTPGRLPEGTELVNITAVLPGTNPALANQHIILGGHYDSINLDPVREGDTYERRDPNRPAPGVNDDISGVAVAMECARVFSQYEFQKTLVFVGFVAEEQGLVGATLLAQKMKAEGKEIEAVLMMDMVGSSVRGGGAPSQPTTVRVFSDGPEDSPSRQIARFMEMIGERYVPEQDIDLIFRRDRFGRGGDHTAFNREGFAGVRLVEANEDYNNQHSYNDTFANLDMDYLMRNARIEAATAATLALASAGERVTMPRSGSCRPWGRASPVT
ncbi:M20/M25/M40 family metallo-hydrolase [Gemmatimonadota bacterium]